MTVVSAASVRGGLVTMGRWICPMAAVAVALLVGGCALLGRDGIHGRYRVSLGADPPPLPAAAVASWAAEPTEPDEGLADAAGPECLSEAGAMRLRGHLLIRDQRGPDAAALLWADGDETMYCLVSRAPGGGVTVHLVGGFATDPGTRGRLRVSDTVCEDPTLVTGDVPAGAGGLVIETEAGLEVAASVADGRFVAWWPGRDDPAALRTATSTVDHDGRC